MAEKGTYTFSSKRRYTKEYGYNLGTKYSVDYNTGTFGYKLEVSPTTSLDNVETTQYLYLPPPSTLSNLLNSGAAFSKLKLSATFTAVSGNTDTPFFYIYAATEEISSNAESGYTALDGMDISANRICSFQANQSGSYSLPSYADTEDSTVIRNALQYGIFIVGLAFSTTDYQALQTLSGSLTVEVEYYTADSPPDIRIMQPSYSGAIAEVTVTDGFQTAWDFIQQAGTPQSGYQIVYKYIPVKNEPLREMTAIISGNASSHFITPDQLPQMRSDQGSGGYNDSVCFYVKGYTQNNTVSSEFDYNTGEYSWRILQLYFPHPYNLYPADQTIMLADEPTELTWQIKFGVEDTGKEVAFTNYPTDFDIEYSSNGGETWDVIASQTTVARHGEVFSYTVPANTFPAGVIIWRVRAYAGGKTIETYESGSFQSRVQASTSSVTCDGKPHPTIGWSSSAQIAYQVRFSDYDSGTIYGVETSHTIPYYYADGTYPVQVRTQASDGTWSDWTELEYVTIKNTAPAGTLTISAVRTRHTVVISWESTAAFAAYILYRNGFPVYIGNAITYTDVAAYGSCDYYVRGISGVNYLQSETVTIDAIPAVDCMYDIQTAQWIPLKYSLQPRVRNYSDTANVVYKSYAGRSYPVAYVDGTKERQANLSYAFKTREEAEQLKSSLGHLVIYKDTAGGRIIGILGAISWSVTKRFAANLTIVQVDFKEDVRYET